VVDFWHVKESYRAQVRYSISQLCQTLLLTHDSPALLPDGSDHSIRLIRMNVLGWQSSHLPLIHTNLGYGTVLTEACAHQGCSATDYHISIIIIIIIIIIMQVGEHLYM
jgi:hypothetical protein